MAQTSSPFTLPDFSYPLPAHRRTFQSIWGVMFVREYLRALNLKASSKHVRQAIEAFGREVPNVKYSSTHGVMVSLKDRFGRTREYRFLQTFWMLQNIEGVYPEFNQCPELLPLVTEGNYTLELDRALTENNIKLWRLSNLLLETDVPSGQDNTTLRVLMGLGWIEAYLDEASNLSKEIEEFFPALECLRDNFSFMEGNLPVVMPTTWTTIGDYIRRAVRSPQKSTTREIARENLLNISYKVKPTEERFTLLMPDELTVDTRCIRNPQDFPRDAFQCRDYTRDRIEALVQYAGESTIESAQRNDRHYKRAKNEWTKFHSYYPDFFTSDNQVAFAMCSESPWFKSPAVFFGCSKKVLEKRCAESQLVTALNKRLPKRISKEAKDKYEILCEFAQFAGLPLPPEPEPDLYYEEPYDIKPGLILPVLTSMPFDHAAQAHDTVVLWRATGRLAAKCLASQGCMPIPVRNSMGSTMIFWVPRLDFEDIKKDVDTFVENIQPFLADIKCYLTQNDIFPSMKDVSRELPLFMLTYAASVLMRNVKHNNEDYDDESDQYMKAFHNRNNISVLPWTMLKLEQACRRPLSIVNLSGKPSLRLTHEGKNLVLKPGVREYTSVGNNPGIFTPMEQLPRRERRILEKMLADLEVEAQNKYSLMPFESITIKAPFRVRSGQFDKFLIKAIPALQAFGFSVDLQDSDVIIDSASLILSVDEGASLSSGGILSENALADFKINLAIGKLRMPKDEIEALLKQTGKLVDVNGQMLFMTKEASEKIRRHLEEPEVSTLRLSAWAKLRALLAGKHLDLPIELSDRLKESLLRLWTAKSLDLPEGVTAQLRPYQHRGFEWLANNVRLGVGSLLADDMGLGKTVQVITLIQHLKNEGQLNEGPVIVVAPASLLVNWKREFTRFAPKLRVTLYHGPKRELHNTFSKPDVMITSYGILSRDIEKLSALPWRLMVLDEAQAVKNTTTAVTKAARIFPVKQVIAVTGTPVENSLKEYWSVLSIVQPGLLGAKTQFDREFANPIEKGGAQSYDALQRFKRITAPFILRRLKTDPSIIADLPEKNVSNRYVSITPAQAALYEKCLKEGMAEVKDAQLPDGKTVNMERKGRILALITRLKQCVNSPSQLRKDFSDKPDSGKAEALLELLDECQENGQKALIFTQYTEMGERLTKWINKHFKITVPFLHGGVSVKERTKLVDRFQKDDKCPLMVLTLKAGGVGLNLTAANVVIHYDLWWNPATENQATDRAYRIGQTKNVLVYRLISVGTFEEKVDQMLAAKRKLADLTVGTGEKWIGDLSDRELEEIFRLDRDV